MRSRTQSSLAVINKLFIFILLIGGLYIAGNGTAQASTPTVQHGEVTNSVVDSSSVEDIASTVNNEELTSQLIFDYSPKTVIQDGGAIQGTISNFDSAQEYEVSAYVSGSSGVVLTGQTTLSSSSWNITLERTNTLDSLYEYSYTLVVELKRSGLTLDTKEFFDINYGEKNISEWQRIISAVLNAPANNPYCHLETELLEDYTLLAPINGSIEKIFSSQELLLLQSNPDEVCYIVKNHIIKQKLDLQELPKNTSTLTVNTLNDRNQPLEVKYPKIGNVELLGDELKFQESSLITINGLVLPKCADLSIDKINPKLPSLQLTGMIKIDNVDVYVMILGKKYQAKVVGQKWTVDIEQSELAKITKNTYITLIAKIKDYIEVDASDILDESQYQVIEKTVAVTITNDLIIIEDETVKAEPVVAINIDSPINLETKSIPVKYAVAYDANISSNNLTIVNGLDNMTTTNTSSGTTENDGDSEEVDSGNPAGKTTAQTDLNADQTAWYWWVLGVVILVVLWYILGRKDVQNTSSK